jgi:phage gp45-like
MWLMSYITKNSLEKPLAVRGRVSNGVEGTAVNSSGEHKRLGLCQPYGIVSVPPDGHSTVVLPLEDGEVMLGVTDNAAKVNVGEVALFSQGGASIVLKNNGDVVINGQVFSRE